MKLMLLKVAEKLMQMLTNACNKHTLALLEGLNEAEAIIERTFGLFHLSCN